MVGLDLVWVWFGRNGLGWVDLLLEFIFGGSSCEEKQGA